MYDERAGRPPDDMPESHMTSFSKRCGPCGGSGYYGTNPRDICAICKGVGAVRLEGQESDYKRCGPCGGTGYFGLEPKDTCTVCGGAGWVQPRLIGSSAEDKTPASRTGSNDIAGSRPTIFLVHGQNHAIRDQLDLFLTKDLGLTVRVMAAGPHKGRTLPEKFEEVAATCAFAVFVLTADDVLRTADGRSVRQARQNVILEIGYFWGTLGRRGRVAFLVENHSEMELPSDVQGIGWISITGDLGETKLRLRQELAAAGVLR